MEFTPIFFTASDVFVFIRDKNPVRFLLGMGLIILLITRHFICYIYTSAFVKCNMG